MQMMRDEQGFTLIEVLATLSILSFVGIIIWNVFFQGYQYSQNASSKNSMIQETNIIITNLSKIHQTSDEYEIKSSNSNCGITITYKKGISQETLAFDHPQLCFSFVFKNSISGIINPKLTDVPLTVTASDKKNPNNKISIDSTLYRMKGGRN
jgi:prepilin-type N-terminal cleavage/methylation domain-containing protein